MTAEVQCPFCNNSFPLPLKRHFPYVPKSGEYRYSSKTTLCRISSSVRYVIAKEGESVNCGTCLRAKRRFETKSK